LALASAQRRPGLARVVIKSQHQRNTRNVWRRLQHDERSGHHAARTLNSLRSFRFPSTRYSRRPHSERWRSPVERASLLRRWWGHPPEGSNPSLSADGQENWSGLNSVRYGAATPQVGWFSNAAGSSTSGVMFVPSASMMQMPSSLSSPWWQTNTICAPSGEYTGLTPPQ
jgi:hypothetical protein